MSRRRLFWCGAALAFLLAGGVGLWYCTRETVHITRENFERIEFGMTQQEVEAILGGPPGVYRRGNSVVYVGHDWGDPLITVYTQERSLPTWYGTKGAIRLYLSEEGRVANMNYFDAHEFPLTLWERIRSWFP